MKNDTEKRITYNLVNKYLNPLGYELVKGEGYMYFWILEDSDSPLPYCSSIASMHISRFTLVEMLEHLIYKLEETRLNTYSETKTEQTTNKINEVQNVINILKNQKDS